MESEEDACDGHTPAENQLRTLGFRLKPYSRRFSDPYGFRLKSPMRLLCSPGDMDSIRRNPPVNFEGCETRLALHARIGQLHGESIQGITVHVL